ncbi:MAG: transporter [Sulfuricaulis sp.]|nr:transporter [Sulfuricaulis sp.]
MMRENTLRENPVLRDLPLNNKWWLQIFICALVPATAQAAHPLITEDTGTQSTGRFQLELMTEQGYRDEDYAAKHGRQFAATLSYGARDNMDLIISVPYQRLSSDIGGGIETHSGKSDAGFDIKWNFYENETLSMALKPGVTFPSGDETVGLGSGKSGYSLYHVTSFEPKPWAFHLQLGYRRNRNIADEREVIWHVSFAGWREFGEKLKIVGDIGANTNTDKSSSTEAVFLILGAIYSLTQNIDLDFGFKRGLTNVETDYTLLGGMAIRF